MARNLAVPLSSAEAEFAEIIAWYQDALERATPPSGLEWQPVCIGPTWQYDNGWVLPTYTLGWRVLAWCGRWLEDRTGKPWQFTAEQARFVLWFYALDDDGSFLYHSAVLQRVKGWGKDPILAAISAAALFADVTFDHWDEDIPVGREEPNAWVQLVAVNLQQTQNTMKLFPSLFGPECRRYYGVQVGKLNVWGLGDTRQIQAVTASPLAIEGGRPTLIGRNETQNWIEANAGHEMAGAIEGNAAKSPDGTARILDICNAYRPGRDSVAERVHKAWEATQGENPEYAEFGLLYDSLEAPPDAPLSVAAAPGVIEAIRGDATWLSVKRILASILNGTNSASESRRKWYNQIVAAEDARFDPNKVKLCATTDALQPDDEIVVFGDGSKSDDATGLVGCRLSDGLCQTLHIQQPKKGQIVDRGAVDHAVTEMMETYRVVAFFFDPSHAKDDEAEDDERFFWPLCDEWSRRYGRRLKIWAVKSGDNKHAVAWDMTSRVRLAQFVPAVEQLDADITSGVFRFHQIGHSSWLLRHLVNARRHPGPHGVSMRKDGRESRHKIDLAVCTAGARMLRRMVLLSRKPRKSGKGRVLVLT
ncbi:MAG TPA: hypothetical protein VHB02_06080 [Acidimicrobiales bacterium]|nr:hypothetical protein [Acidimicrobiales bacterium]